MLLHSYLWLLKQESRQLLASKSWWLMLLSIGPLVGLSFISAVHTYSEVSVGGGVALAPLVGIWAPTFSACELVAVFLLPFVAISLVASAKQSGALKLELQQPLSTFAMLSAKALILFLGWLIAMLPPFSALVLWKSYGGTLYPPELFSLSLGQLLNAGLTISLAALAAALTESQSTAAIITLGATIGTWVISIAGAIQGGWWERAAAFTPAAMVYQFQHGLVQLDVIFIAVLLMLTGLSLAAIGIKLSLKPFTKAAASLLILAITAVAIFASTLSPLTWDLSESRANSFPRPDEAALKTITAPLSVDVHLAAQDPRRQDLERNALSKLRRLLPNLRIRYIAQTSTGLFEQATPNYGEIWYQIAGHRTISRATTQEGVLEAIYQAAAINPPPESTDDDNSTFRGHPLATTPRGAAVLFYLLWPAFFISGAILSRKSL